MMHTILVIRDTLADGEYLNEGIEYMDLSIPISLLYQSK